MLLNSDKINDVDYKKDWPKRFYDISDVSLRERILRDVILELSGEVSSDADLAKSLSLGDGAGQDVDAEALACDAKDNLANCDDLSNISLEDEQRRLEILLRRFPVSKKKQKRIDKFTAAWMDLLIDTRLGINFINKGRVKKDVIRCLKDLLVLDFTADDILLREWRQFAEFWITSCVKDSTYDSTAFGILRLSDKRLGSKIASEIIDITYTLPSKFGFDEECGPIRDIFKSTFLKMIDNGDIYWSEAMKK